MQYRRKGHPSLLVTSRSHLPRQPPWATLSFDLSAQALSPPRWPSLILSLRVPNQDPSLSPCYDQDLACLESLVQLNAQPPHSCRGPAPHRWFPGHTPTLVVSRSRLTQVAVLRSLSFRSGLVQEAAFAAVCVIDQGAPRPVKGPHGTEQHLPLQETRVGGHLRGRDLWPSTGAAGLPGNASNFEGAGRCSVAPWPPGQVHWRK